MKTLTWRDVEGVAKEAFSVWVDHPEIKWAKRAWEIIIGTGLASHSNEDERCEAAIRFLALCGIYYDFCEIALEEYNEPDCGAWAKELGIGAIGIGLRLGYDPDDWLNRYEDDEALYDEGVKCLADRARGEVFEALYKGFRNRSADGSEGNEADLFLSLWKSSWPNTEMEDDETEDGRETDFEILNNVTEGKAAAYEWISSGCGSLH
jgi:hypothetical protein